MTYLLFFWERKSMRALIKKNLVAHKNTNKLTSAIYALTLGCVIFLCVALNLVLKSTEGFTGSGQDLTLKEADIALNRIYTLGIHVTPDVDDVLRKYSPDIKDFGWIARDLQTAMAKFIDNVVDPVELVASDKAQSIFLYI